MSTAAIPAASTVAASTTGATASAATGSPVDLDTAGADTTESGFSDLFSDVLHKAKPDESVPDQLLSSDDSAAALLQPVNPDGKTLPPYVPLVAWSGTVAVGDNQGASALAMQGDNTTLSIGKPVSAGDMTTALQAAIQQQPQAVINSASTASNTETNFQNWLNKFDSQPASLSQAAMSAVGNDTLLPVAKATDANPLTALAAATSSAVAPANNQALPYVQTARYDQPLGTIPLPVTHPDWGNQLGDGVRWMAQQNIQTADLRLNPPNLGMLEVHIKLNADQANVTFTSPHAAVRDAIEHALPRLRDMLGETGLQLGDVNVSQQSLSQHQSHPEQFARSQDSTGNPLNEEPASGTEQEMTAIQLPRHGQGLLDMYA